jgi:hypothetical protein
MKAGQEIPGTLPLQASIDAMKAQGFGSSFKPPPPTQPQPRLSVAARQARDNASGLTALRTKMGMQPTAGQAAAEAILGSGGDPKAYMAARGATPIGTMGSGQPKPRARPTAPAAVTPNKGRTSSMQRRGIGAGQAPGQPVPGKKAGPVTPAQAAQNFIAGRANKAQPAPVAAPPVAAQPRPIAAPVVR